METIQEAAEQVIKDHNAMMKKALRGDYTEDVFCDFEVQPMLVGFGRDRQELVLKKVSEWIYKRFITNPDAYKLVDQMKEYVRKEIN